MINNYTWNFSLKDLKSCRFRKYNWKLNCPEFVVVFEDDWDSGAFVMFGCYFHVGLILDGKSHSKWKEVSRGLKVLGLCKYSLYDLEVLGLCKYSLYDLKVLGLCKYLLYDLKVLGLCKYSLYDLKVLGLCKYSLYDLKVLGLCEYSLYDFDFSELQHWKWTKVCSS